MPYDTEAETVPVRCPVCGSCRISRHSAEKSFVSNAPLSLSYRCEQGHIFLVLARAVGVSRSGT